MRKIIKDILRGYGLSAAAHIAIELDGGQHLDNPEAYRRDRRKDVLLQENGFQVLRFLCEDVGNAWMKFWV